MGTRGTTPSRGTVPRAPPRAIPTSASPSGGAQTDDVSAVGPGNSPMRVNAGEFILPQRTVQHYGTKFLQNLIAKGDKAQGLPDQGPAGPEMKAVDTGNGGPGFAGGGTTGQLREFGVTGAIPLRRLEPRNPHISNVGVPLPTMALPASQRGIGHMHVTPSFNVARRAA